MKKGNGNRVILAASTLSIIVYHEWHAFVSTRFHDATTNCLLEMRRQSEHLAYLRSIKRLLPNDAVPDFRCN